MTIYSTRYQARKAARSSEIVARVEGGYIIMDAMQYRAWRGQR